MTISIYEWLAFIIVWLILFLWVITVIICSPDFVDKRGSKVKKTSTEDLHKFYEMSDESDKGMINSYEKTNKWN